MIPRQLLPGLGAMVLMLGGTAANAFSIDYANIADTQGEAGYSAYTTSDSGVSVTATGTVYGDPDDTPDYFAYLDAGNAGLGVCKILTSSDQCSPSSDDNVTLNEALTLTFDQTVVLDEILFRNANHGTTFQNGADIKISIDGGVFNDFTLQHQFNTPLTGNSFTFVGDISGDDDEFYISNIAGTPHDPGTGVPTPGGLLLLGIGGVALRRFRR